MSKKYFIADLDGTLIHRSRSYLHPSIEEEEAIKRFISQGNEFMIATGRMLNDVNVVLANLGVTSSYAITQNGAYIYKNNQEIRGVSLTAEQVRELEGLIKKWGYKPEYISISTSSCKTYMKTFTLKGIAMKFRFNSRTSETKQVHAWKNNTFKKLEEKHVKIARFLIAYHNADKLRELEQKLTDYFGNKVSIYASGKYSLEVCAAGVSKAEAIKYIMHVENIAANDIAFVGDSGNDVSVFETLPHTYVMAHAQERFKIEGTVEVPRVAYAIDDFMESEFLEENEK